MTLAALTALFLFGLLGSGHCVGMCGPIVLASSQWQSGARRLQLHHALYGLGKTLTYALLGAVVGGTVGVLGEGLEAYLRGAQLVLGGVIGGGMVVLGVGLLLGKRWLEGGGVVSRLPGYRTAFRALVRDRLPSASFALGALSGTLPCGLVYAALTLAAASASALEGAARMAAFGLGTMPALVLVGTVGFSLSPLLRGRLYRAAGAFLVLAGLVTALRGTPVWGWIHHAL
ncbi:MAG: sulfite exporter TauE/SafE family protein [Rubricoccaceae bacterium]